MSEKSRWTPDLANASKEDCYYALTMFPYPSGYGLHVGHASVCTINDIVARYKRMQGKVVLNPIGFDSFGLPTENYAMKLGKPTYEVTKENIQTFLKQIEALQLSFDEERIFATSDPEYYKWTQRIFQELYKAGLAYRDELRVNRCPDCQTVLANDQVVEGHCERCKSAIIQKKMPQWFIKITDYAERLIDDLDLIDRPEETKIAQKNRIGKSQGAEINFDVQGTTVTVFTTRPDTLYGVTALVLAPENTLLDDLLEDGKETVLKYRKETMSKTSVERQQNAKEKTGVDSGLEAKHPLTGEMIPVRYADYVLPDYATGSVMMVPAHDQRDYEFARKFGIPIVQVIEGNVEEGSDVVRVGVTINSGQFDGLHYPESKDAIIDYIEEQNIGKRKITYKLRDWSVSRQRYWGSPIPVYYDDAGNHHLIPEEELPVVLPLDVKNYKPKGKSPLEEHDTFPIYKKKMKVLLIHGRGNSRNDPGCLQGIKDTFEKKGVAVDFPNLTYHEDYDFDKVMKDLEGYDADIVVGHSSGGYLAMHYALKYGASHIIQLSPTIDLDNMSEGLKEWSLEVFGKENSEKNLAFHNHSIDYEKLNDKNVTIFFGDIDTVVDSYYQEKFSSLLPDARIKVLDLIGHMGSSEATNSIDEINDFIDTLPTEKSFRRECDTLDTFMCSSFYFLRFPDAYNNDELINKEIADKILPVDIYSGGKEHTVGHLLYARFIHKFLYDKGYVNSSEPFKKLVHQGMIAGADGRKMSKRWGNVIDPLDVIEKYGSDAVRTYLMFMGPVEQDKTWNDNALKGIKKFIDRIERLLPESTEFSDVNDTSEAKKVLSKYHETIQGMTYDLEHLKFNTAVSKIMILVNTIYDNKSIPREVLEGLALFLSPFAPTIADRLRQGLGNEGDIAFASRPVADESKIMRSTINLPVQVNGKMRGNIDINPGTDEATVLAKAQEVKSISKYIDGKPLKKVIYVQDRILNLIV